MTHQRGRPGRPAAFDPVRYGRRNRPASQEVQQRIAELTAEAEENIGGVRVVKAFAQEQRQLRRFGVTVARVFDQSMISTRLRAFYSPFIGFLPQLGLAALLFVGGKQVIDGQLSEGDFVAFYGYVLLLTGPMRMLGMALGMAQRAVASGGVPFPSGDARVTPPERLERHNAQARTATATSARTTSSSGPGRCSIRCRNEVTPGSRRNMLGLLADVVLAMSPVNGSRSTCDRRCMAANACFGEHRGSPVDRTARAHTWVSTSGPGASPYGTVHEGPCAGTSG